MDANIVLTILLLITVFGVGVVLVVGVTSTVGSDPLFRNQMMRLRVALQGAAVVIIILMFLVGNITS